MAKNSVDAYGASGKTNVLMFEPEKLHLVSDRNHPLYDERIHLPIDEAMVLNIMDQGVIEPLVIWKDPETGHTCVVDGRQRVAHTMEANKRLAKKGEPLLFVPAVVRKVKSVIRAAEAMISANEIRRNDTPLGRAKKMADAMERGHDEAHLSVMFGVGIPTVRATLALLDATQDVKDAVESGTVTVTQARQLVDMPPQAQRETVQQLRAAAEGVTGHEKARRQRAVLGDVKPRLKTRKEITKALQSATGDYAEALRWVLGDSNPSI